MEGLEAGPMEAHTCVYYVPHNLEMYACMYVHACMCVRLLCVKAEGNCI